MMAAAEHDPEVDWKIRVVKEYLRDLSYTLPFEPLPDCLIIGDLNFDYFGFKSFPFKNGISYMFSPQAMIVTNFDYIAF